MGEGEPEVHNFLSGSPSPGLGEGAGDKGKWLINSRGEVNLPFSARKVLQSA